MTENEILDASLGAVDSPKAVSETQSPLSSNVSKPPSKQSSSTSPQAPPVPAFPPPKTDKPRPHVCTTCGRSFARLEHLKRHERSHTKEKPFECQACTRCFARRDLLLRHQQKLHSTTTPSSRPRNGRRESVAGVANGRVRKNSIAGSTTNAMRPRANTLSHIDAGTLGMLSGSAFNRQHPNMHTSQTSFGGMSSQPDFGYRSMGLSHSSGLMGLPRIDTHSLAVDTSSGLRTAPPYGGFGAGFDMDMMGYTQGHSSTINPHELHTPSMHGLGIDHSGDFGHGPFTNASASQAILDDDNMFEWVTNGFDNQLSFVNTSENAIESSPSAMSTNSPANFQENANPRNKSQSMNAVSKTDNVWQTSAFSHAHMVNSPAGIDVSAMFFDVPSAENTISPKSLLAQSNGTFDVNFPTPPEFSTPDQMNHSATTQTMFNLPFKHEHFASTASSSSVDSSMRHNSIASPFGEIVTNRMRNTLITSLSMHHGFGQRRQSVPVISSPLSSHKHDSFNIANFPSTSDLQRYAAAYFQYCHPHLPFLHLPTMNFESVEYQSRGWGIGPDLGNVASASPIGGCCLLLAIAAMGALFEHESSHSKSLFEHSKRMISGFLEGRRQSQVNRSSFLSSRNADVEDTPLWLVQAMLLNVVYGHNCGDKTAADIASNQCAALVSLARGADLTKPYLGYFASTMQSSSSADARNMTGQEGTDLEWLDWKHAEERKRTLYAIFVLSSMLVMAYNRPPALTNSEVRLDLPCDEEFWAADSAASWKALGGGQAIKTRAIPFAGALTHLLTAALREHQTQEPAPVLKPSSFGCLVLIDALHNYIWETRQRHLGRQWTPSEIESMHAHIEPALRAWMTAWSSNPVHVLERPNPFGAGPLPADSIPLLDLAYVRLFVDFGRSKEAYWQRDYDTMAQELANRAEPGLGRRMSTAGSDAFVMSHQMMINNASVPTMLSLDEEVMSSPREVEEPGKPSRRERHLRRAAFYAADHLWNADRLGVAFGEQTSRDLPMQSILCACDCAQVLAEWVTTLQERVGRYVGVLGDDEIDVHGYPLVNMLDEEDAKLLSRMEELLAGAEHRVEDVAALNEARRGGYGGRILALTSQTMSRAALWPVTRLMAQSLNIQARHVQARVQSSTLA